MLRNLFTRLHKRDKANYLKNTFDRMEADNYSASLHTTSKELLGVTRAGPPTCFQQAGYMVRKQQELAEMQSSYYQNKITEIKQSLPRVNQDPLKYLKRAFRRWLPPSIHPFPVLFFISTAQIQVRQGWRPVKTQI